MSDFLVARNPFRQVKLPYVLCVPLADRELWFLANEAWPRASRVFCWPLQQAPRSTLEIIERVLFGHVQELVRQSIYYWIVGRVTVRSSFSQQAVTQRGSSGRPQRLRSLQSLGCVSHNPVALPTQ
jgi:hypothetical protein